MIKIEIKSIYGAVLFSYEKENNTIKDTLSEGVAQGADLQGADLQGADLQGADLRGADLREADLRWAYLRDADLRWAYLLEADLRWAYLRDADLQEADLRGADLRWADLRGADLRGADLREADLREADLQGAKYGDIEIKKSQVFTGLYKYLVMPIIATDGTEYVRLGCHFRTVEEWNADFWNNNNEFPNDGCLKSSLRLMAFNTCLEWLKLNRQ